MELRQDILPIVVDGMIRIRCLLALLIKQGESNFIVLFTVCVFAELRVNKHSFSCKNATILELLSKNTILNSFKHVTVK
jgi:hypothetical protein